MISKMFRIALTIVLASFALSSAAWATCSNSSLVATYGFLGGGTDADGKPSTSVVQFTVDQAMGTLKGTQTLSSNGVITSESITGTYKIASNCTGTGTLTVGGGSPHPFSFVVTNDGNGIREVDGKEGTTHAGIGVAQGSPTCTNAGVKGSFGLEATGVFVTGAPFTGPLALIGELALSVNAAGDGVISGNVAGSENGTILTFTEELVTGSYSVNKDCTGTFSITPEGKSALNFSFVIVNGGSEMLAILTDADTVVSGTLQR